MKDIYIYIIYKEREGRLGRQQERETETETEIKIKKEVTVQISKLKQPHPINTLRPTAPMSLRLKAFGNNYKKEQR